MPVIVHYAERQQPHAELRAGFGENLDKGQVIAAFVKDHPLAIAAIHDVMDNVRSRQSACPCHDHLALEEVKSCAGSAMIESWRRGCGSRSWATALSGGA